MKLAQVKLGVATPFAQQFSVISLLQQLPLLQDENAVGGAHCREAVGNHKNGAALHQPLQRFLHQRF